MNELELIALKMNALVEADRHARALEASGQISLEQRDAWLDENRDKRDRLVRRRTKLNETQGGTTPILSPDQAQSLRTAVEKLHAQNLGEAAVRALLQEVLTVAEAVTNADIAESDPVERTTGASTAEAAKTDTIHPIALAALIAAAVGLSLAIFASTRRRR